MQPVPCCVLCLLFDPLRQESSAAERAVVSSEAGSIASDALSSPALDTTLLCRAACALLYGQCGGVGWDGPECCIAGASCMPETSSGGYGYGYGGDGVGGYGVNDAMAYSMCMPETTVTGMGKTIFR